MKLKKDLNNKVEALHSSRCPGQVNNFLMAPDCSNQGQTRNDLTQSIMYASFLVPTI